MSFDRSHPKRQRLDFARQDHVYSAQSSTSWASFSADANVEVPISQLPSLTTFECSIAIRVNGESYDHGAIPELYPTRHTASHQSGYQSPYPHEILIGMDDNIDIPTNLMTPEIDTETNVCYGMVLLFHYQI